MDQKISCPRCRIVLGEIFLQGLSVQRCSQCKSFFADRKEWSKMHFNRLLQTEEFLGPSLKETNDIYCPYDSNKMTSITVPPAGFILQACPECNAVWIDFLKLSQFVEKQRKMFFWRKNILMALGFLSFLFVSFFLKTWLTVHFPAGMIKIYCIVFGAISCVTLLFFSLVTQDKSYFEESAGLYSGVILGLVYPVGKKGWKALTLILATMAIICLLAWIGHPDRSRGPKTESRKIMNTRTAM